MSNIPEIRINHGFLLTGRESKILARDLKMELDSEEQYEKWSANYRNEWKKYHKKILAALQEALGVNFYKSVIDVTCAPFFIPKSDPLIMNFRYLPDEFVDVLTHELCHVLLTDNNRIQIRSEKPPVQLGDVWESLFGKHDFTLLVHIPVQALMKYIYLDILQESPRLERDIKRSQEYGRAYRESWRYVEENNYQEIISKLQKSYLEITP